MKTTAVNWEHAIAGLWKRVGPNGVTYASVAAETGKPRGSVGHRYPTGAKLMERAAVAVIDEAGYERPLNLDDPMDAAASLQREPERLALTEAICWLARQLSADALRELATEVEPG